MLIVRIFTSLGLLVFGGNDQEGNAFEIVEIGQFGFQVDPQW